MEHDRGELIRSVFLAALGLQAPERSRLLDERCGEDSELRREVESLLAHDVHGSPFLESPAVYLPTPLERLSPAEPAWLEHPGDLIGAYRLVRVVGEGTFGTVWQAERLTPFIQTVALKIIKPGMDSRAVIARFEQERQSLAVMDHPNVARVIDGGMTAHGRPYFVMEYVEGQPITSYADRKGLGVAKRLKLFEPVCEAVQHAHSKGIIHRDLKPNNILIDEKNGVAIPKVIDFGVAKSVGTSHGLGTVFTEHGQMIGTPEYMSPEQASGGATDIDTRTDVYALGVVLYELLTGKLPFDSKTLRSAALAEVQRIIREVAPSKPSTRVTEVSDFGRKLATPTGSSESAPQSQPFPIPNTRTLSRQLQGDLDWVVMRCLEKDRTRRYATPAALGEELTRILRGETVKAGPPSATYRLRKFIKRNRGQVVGVAAVMLALAIGLVAAIAAGRQTLAALGRESEQRQKAEATTAKLEKSSEKIEYDSYVANVQMASALMDLRKPDLVRQRLDACPERLRGWEWDWLNAKSDNSIAILKGHTAAVSTVAFSPNGAQFVTASSDSTARVWDATTHRSIVLSGSPKEVMSASFSPDGKRVLTVSRDFVARVWDAVTGVNTVTLDRFPTPNSPGRMADHALFSPDGTRIVAGTYQGLIEVHEAGTGKFLMEWDGERGKIESMSFSPDGTRLATASDGSAGQVWDLSTGKLLVEFARHRGQPDKVMFSPDGKKVITAGAGGAVRVWDVATGACLHELGGHSESVSAIAYSPDGHCIVTSSFSGEVWVWDAATGTRRFDLKGHTSLVKAISFNLDGKRFVTGSGDCTARLWDSTTGEALAEFVGHTGRVSSVAFAPDGRTVVTASSDGTARVWDAAAPPRVGWPRGWNNTGSLKPPDFPAPVTLGAFSPDGSRVVTGTSSGTIRIWDSTTRALLLELHGHSEQVDSAAFSPDGAWIVTTSFDNTARAWDATTGDCIMVMNGVARGESTSGYRPPVVVVSPDSIRLAIGSWDGTSALWNSHTWQPICPFESNVAEVRCALPFAFSPDGKRVATVAGSITRVWDAAAGTHLFDLEGHKDAISCIAFTPDGQRIATADVKGQVSLWNAATGTRLLELGGNAGSVFAIAVDPTGTRMATMSNDGPAWMWDVHTGARVCTLQVNNEPLRRAVFTPDGKRLLSGSWSGKGRVWNVEWGRSMLEMANVFVSSQGPSDWQWSPDSMRILATHEESGRVFDAIPYRERFAYVEAFRSSTSRLKPRILQRIRSGERAFDLRREYCGLHELQISERHAAMAIICEEEQRVTGRAEVNPQSSQTLTSTAWQVVRSEQSASAAGPAGLAIALDQARQARTVFPERQENCVALGVCLFRLGRYEEAIAMLQTPEATYGKANPVNIAVIAMSQFKLGQRAEARSSLSELRRAVAKLPAAVHEHELLEAEDTREFVRQAESVIEAGPAPSLKP